MAGLLSGLSDPRPPQVLADAEQVPMDIHITVQTSNLRVDDQTHTETYTVQVKGSEAAGPAIRKITEELARAISEGFDRVYWRRRPEIVREERLDTIESFISGGFRVSGTSRKLGLEPKQCSMSGCANSEGTLCFRTGCPAGGELRQPR
jgi:hypothetical protein